MEANELRIGNYVKIPNLIKPIQVSIIDTTRTASQTTAKPIPLSIKWLLDFGFEKVEHDYRIQIQKDDKHGNTDYWIYVDTGFDNLTDEFTIQLVSQQGGWFTSKNKYVHQLQNLYFALKGKELTIKNQ